MQIRNGPVFQAGQFLSDAFSLAQLDPYFLITPDAWTAPANLRFMFSPDGLTYNVVHYDGVPLEVLCPAPNAAVKLRPEMRTWPNGTYLKFLSAYNDSKIIQPVLRTFKLVAA